MTYLDFLASKQLVVRPSGVTVDDGQIHPSLFPFQRDLTRWALRKGRAAIFADTGLGKTRMQIEWARPIWYGIRESDTLNVAEARTEDDERHIAPLQLETIRRCVLLWSNPGDLVLSPFAGIGSEGYEAIQQNRRFLGIELKPEYFKVAVKNLREAERKRDEGTLLGLIEEG